MKLEINRAGVKDHGLVTRLLLEFARVEGIEAEVDRDRWEGVLAGLLDSDGWLFLLATDEEGEAVGLAAVNWYLTLYGSSVDGRIVAMIVDEDYRRQGVGTQLMEEVLAASRRRGCREMEVALRRSDEMASFYRQFEPGSIQELLIWDCGD